MQKILYITLLLGGLVYLTACEKWIEVDPPSNQINTDQVFEDVATANAALSGLYSGLREQSMFSGNNYGLGALLDIYTDGLDCYYDDLNGYTDIWRNQVLATNTTVDMVWMQSFQYIYYANAIINGMDQSGTISEIDNNRIKGEAMLIRSFIYLNLQQLFGKIPYTTALSYEANKVLPKLDEADLLVQLESDLTVVIQLLENEYRDAERIYPNRKAAELLLARVYALQQKWPQVESLSNEILSSSLYHFQPEVTEVFHKSGDHIIWQMKPQNENGGVNDAAFYYFQDAAPFSYALTTDLVDAFSDLDLRKQEWIVKVELNGQSWFRARKYRNLDGANTNEYAVLLRLEEVYFLMAEALAKQGRVEEALPYLNATRLRANLTALDIMSEDVFIEELLNEKRREFFTEFGHRFFDLKRMGKLDILQHTKPNWKADFRVWPLPQKEILLNKNLLPQNAGY